MLIIMISLCIQLSWTTRAMLKIYLITESSMLPPLSKSNDKKEDNHLRERDMYSDTLRNIDLLFKVGQALRLLKYFVLITAQSI